MTEATFLHGDCLEVLTTLPKRSVNLAFCDLPYGVIAQDWDVRLCLHSLWNLLAEVFTDTYACVMTATQPFATDVIVSNRKNFRHELVWDKGASGAIGAAAHRPLPVHEGVYVFGTPKAYIPVKTPRKHPRSDVRRGVNSTTGMRRFNTVSYETYPTSVFRISKYSKERGLHATQKPVELMRWIIANYSRPGDTVLDPTAGSGTTAVAALLEGRHSISIEKDPVIYANAKERVMAVQRSLRRPADA